MCEFCDAKLYQYGSAIRHEMGLYDARARMEHAGRGSWELHVLEPDGEMAACFPVYYCPMCGRRLAERGK